MPQFRIHHAVEFEFREVRAWYAGHSPWRRMFRRVRLVRFPYLVIFHADAQTTSVLALVHQRQEPERKKAMLSRRLGGIQLTVADSVVDPANREKSVAQVAHIQQRTTV